MLYNSLETPCFRSCATMQQYRVFGYNLSRRKIFLAIAITTSSEFFRTHQKKPSNIFCKQAFNMNTHIHFPLLFFHYRIRVNDIRDVLRARSRHNLLPVRPSWSSLAHNCRENVILFSLKSLVTAKSCSHNKKENDLARYALSADVCQKGIIKTKEKKKSSP